METVELKSILLDFYAQNFNLVIGFISFIGSGRFDRMNDIESRRSSSKDAVQFSSASIARLSSRMKHEGRRKKQGV